MGAHGSKTRLRHKTIDPRGELYDAFHNLPVETIVVFRSPGRSPLLFKKVLVEEAHHIYRLETDVQGEYVIAYKYNTERKQLLLCDSLFFQNYTIAETMINPTVVDIQPL